MTGACLNAPSDLPFPFGRLEQRPDGAPQKIRLDTLKRKHEAICHLLSRECAEVSLFLGTGDASHLRPRSAPDAGAVF